MDYILSLDAGKWAVKSMGRNAAGTEEDIKKIPLRTKILELGDKVVDPEGNSYFVELDKEKYIVGEQGETRSYKTNKTIFLHKICAYTAITKFLKPGTKDNKIYMCLACPVDALEVEQKKEEYRTLIKGDGPISITVNDEKFTFEIMDIIIKAEGSGIVYTHPELFKDCATIVFDIGGVNLNFAYYIDGVCKLKDRFSEEFGATALTEYVARDLTAASEDNEKVNFDEAEEALERGHLLNFGDINKNSIDVISASKNKFLNEIITITERHGYDIKKAKNIVFVGGTTKKIEEQIKKHFANAFVALDSQWITSEGLYKVALAKYIKVFKSKEN